MQALTQEQGDGVLDLLGVCHRTTHAYEQKTAFEQGCKALSDSERRLIGQGVSTAFTLAMQALALSFDAALELGVNLTTLEYVLLKNLPLSVRDIFGEAA